MLTTCLICTLHSFSFSSAVTNAAEAAAEFKTMCNLVKLLETKAADLAADPAVAADTQDILKLNMSASDETGRANFGDGTEKHNWEASKATYAAADYKQDWENKWDGWLTTAHHLQPGVGNDKWLKEHPPPLSKAQAAVAATQLKRLAEQVVSAKQNYNNIISGSDAVKGAAINSKLATALNKVPDAPDKTAEQFAKETRTARSSTTCAADKAGVGVLYDLMCLCIGQQNTHSKNCVGAALKKGWTTTRGELEQALTQLKAHCRQGTTSKLTGSNLRRAVQTIEALIRAHGTTTVLGDKLGISDNADFDGDDGKICVKYDSYYSSTVAAPKEAKMPWMQAVEEAANLLDKQKEKKQAATAKAAQIAFLKASAEVFYAAAHITAPTAQTSAQGALQSKPTADCTNIKTNSTCTADNNCKWTGGDSEKGKCVVDESKVTEQTSGEEKGETETERLTTGCKNTELMRLLVKKLTKGKRNLFVHGKKAVKVTRTINELRCRNCIFIRIRKFSDCSYFSSILVF
uniref:Variant surface glycoprotein 1125.4296 n=1 Tax=Trypanosoma brucei TaxID=5691 RepID=A0A1J0RAK4_9TRYP|nr:variant surface glycoprotein 1125.4296 [Trypanosoma brucei]